MTEIAYGSREEWLEMRSRYIGGSDAGAAIGMDQYKSPFALWAEKTGKVPGFEGNLTTRVGSYLEDLVAGLWCEETGKKCRRKNRTLVNDKYPWACADLDRTVVGERAALEIKTTNSVPVMRTVRGGDYPDRWYAQMVHYMAVAELDRMYLAVLVNCRELLCFTLERDEAEVEALMAAEEEFWQYVTSNTPPPVDGSDATQEALGAIYHGAAPGEADIASRADLLAEWRSLKTAAKSIDQRVSEIEAVIKADLGDMERGRAGEDWVVSWRPQTRRIFQADRLRADFPDLDLDPYYKTTQVRPLRITYKTA